MAEQGKGFAGLLGNVFGTTPPAYMEGLLGQEATEDLRKRSIGTGIANALLGYAAMPKNKNLGLGRILAGAAQAGIGGAQGVYKNATQDYVQGQAIEQAKIKQQQNVAQQAAMAKAIAQYPEYADAIRANPALLAKIVEKEITPRERKTATIGNQLVDVNTGKSIFTGQAEMKAPPTRDRIVGGMTIQETMVGAPTPENPEGIWKEIGRGSRYKPEEQVTFDDNMVDVAAQIYLKTGVMPSLGAGSSKLRQEILNRAANIGRDAGLSAGEIGSKMVENKAIAGGIYQLTKQKVMVGAFEKNAAKNADIALQLSDTVDRTGIPVFNAWLQAGQKSVTGNPAISAFNAANETFVNEYAKIMSGSMGNTPVSDSARAHAHEMLSTTQTPEQYKAVMNVLKAEMQNRMAGFNAEIEEASKKSNFKDKRNATLSQEDKDAIEWLSANPNHPQAAAVKQKLGVK